MAGKLPAKMAGNLPTIWAVQGTVSSLWEMEGIPTGKVSPKCIATYPTTIVFIGIPLFVWDNQSHKAWYQWLKPSLIPQMTILHPPVAYVAEEV